MAKKKVIEIDVDTLQSKTAIGQIVELFKKMVSAEKEAEVQAKKTEKAVEDVGKGASKAKKGFTILKSGIKGIGTALKGAGIGLFIGALALLKEAFEGNEKVQKAFKIGAEFVTAVVGELVDIVDSAVTKVANATNGFESMQKVIDSLLTLAMTPLKLAFFGLAKGIAQAQLLWEKSMFGSGDEGRIKELEESIDGYNTKIIKTGVEAVKAGKEYVKNIGGALVEIGKVGGAIVDGLEEADIKANILRGKQEEADAEAEKKAEERKNRAIKRAQEKANKEAEILKANKEKLEQIEQGYVEKKQDLDAKTAEEELELERQRAQAELDAIIYNGTEKEEAQLALDAYYNEKKKELDEQRKQEDAEKKLEEDLLQAENEEIAFQERLELLAERRRLIDENDALSDEQKLIQKQSVADAETKITEKKEKEDLLREKQVQDAKIGLAQDAFKLAGALAEEGSALAKGVQVAQTIMSTIQGVQSAYTSAQGSPYAKLFPGYPLVQAGIAGAFGAISVQKILATPTKSSGGGGAPSVGGGGGSAPPPAFNLVGGSGVDEIGGTLSTETEPVKAYVVGADVTNQQEIDNAQAESASLG